MLASPAQSVSEALAELGRAALEWKLDGGRVQVHKRGDEVRVFTRRLNEVTDALPEVVESVRALAPRELILDGEALAFRADGRPEPFQATMQRFGRKLDVDALRASLPLRPFFFDCLRVDGEIVLSEDVQVLDKRKKHTVEIVVDRLALTKGAESRRSRARSAAGCPTW